MAPARFLPPLQHPECPYCDTEIPLGATVCVGCQGDIVYGIPIHVRPRLVIIGGPVGSCAGLILFKVIFHPTRFEPHYAIGVAFLLIGALVAIVGLFVLTNWVYRGNGTVYRRHVIRR
jgi:hypothetical protein